MEECRKKSSTRGPDTSLIWQNMTHATARLRAGQALVRTVAGASTRVAVIGIGTKRKAIGAVVGGRGFQVLQEGPRIDYMAGSVQVSVVPEKTDTPVRVTKVMEQNKRKECKYRNTESKGSEKKE